MEMLLNRGSLAYVKTAFAGAVARVYLPRRQCRNSRSCRGFYDEKEQRKMDELGESLRILAAVTITDCADLASIVRSFDCFARAAAAAAKFRVFLSALFANENLLSNG